MIGLKSKYLKIVFTGLVMGSYFSSMIAMNKLDAISYEDQVKKIGHKMKELYLHNEDSLDKAIKLTGEVLTTLIDDVQAHKETVFQDFFLYAYFYFRDAIHVSDKELVELKNKYKELFEQLVLLVNKLPSYRKNEYLPLINKTANSLVRDIYLTTKYDMDHDILAKVIARDGFGWAGWSVGKLKNIFVDSDLAAMFTDNSYSPSKFLDNFFLSEKKVAQDLNNVLEEISKLSKEEEGRRDLLALVNAIKYIFFYNPAKIYAGAGDIDAFRCNWGVEQLGRRGDKGYFCSNCGGCIADTHAIQFLDLLIKITKEIETITGSQDYRKIDCGVDDDGTILKETVYMQSGKGSYGSLLDELRGFYGWNLRIFAKQVSYTYSCGKNSHEKLKDFNSKEEAILCEKLVQIEDQIRESAERQSGWENPTIAGVFITYATQVYYNMAFDLYEKGLKRLFSDNSQDSRILKFSNRGELLDAMEALCMTLLIQAGADEAIVKDVKKELSDRDLQPCEKFLDECLKFAPRKKAIETRSEGNEFKRVEVDQGCEFVFYRHVGSDFVEKLKIAPATILDWLKRVRMLQDDLKKMKPQTDEDAKKYAADAAKSARKEAIEEIKETKVAKARAAQGKATKQDWLKILRELHGDPLSSPIKEGIIRDIPSAAIKIGQEKKLIEKALKEITEYEDENGSSRKTTYLGSGNVQGYAPSQFFKMAAALKEEQAFQDFVVKLLKWKGSLKDLFGDIYTGYSNFYITGDIGSKDPGVILFDKNETGIREFMKKKAQSTTDELSSSSDSVAEPDVQETVMQKMKRLEQEAAAKSLPKAPNKPKTDVLAETLPLLQTPVVKKTPTAFENLFGPRVPGTQSATIVDPQSSGKADPKILPVTTNPGNARFPSSNSSSGNATRTATSSGRISPQFGGKSLEANALQASLGDLNQSLNMLQGKLKQMTGALGALTGQLQDLSTASDA